VSISPVALLITLKTGDLNWAVAESDLFFQIKNVLESIKSRIFIYLYPALSYNQNN
jgi:hypothetical protein